MAELIYVLGNVLKPQHIHEKEIIVIPHCCNNLGVMGAGVALTLKNERYDGVKPYFNAVKESPNGLKNRLGEVFCGWYDSKTVIANMIGQDGVGGEKPVRYWALLRAMQDTLAFMGPFIDHAAGEKLVFHCPKFGCDLAGGKWVVVEELIKETWVDRGFDVVVYEFEPDETKWGRVMTEPIVEKWSSPTETML